MAAVVDISKPADGVMQLLLDGGKHNFATWELNEHLERALAQARSDGARVLVLGSAVDGYFTAHGALTDIIATFADGPERPSGDPMAGIRVLRELDISPVVSIAAIEGQAWGHGAETAWACDLRVMSMGATLGQPEVYLGVTPANATRLARIVGEATALRLLLDGAPIGAEEALRLNLVHRVVPEGTALAAAVEWATSLAARPAGALANVKRTMKGGRDRPLSEALKTETAVFVEGVTNPENMERIRAAQRVYEDGGDSFDAFGIPRDR